MIRLTLRSLRANVARLLLSSVSIVLGVAFIAGSLMFTDGLSRAMTDQAAAQYRTTDVEVTPVGPSDAPGSADLVGRIRKVPGVRAAEGVASATSFGIVGKEGRQLRGAHRATTVAVDPALRMLDASQGRLPQKRGEIVLDEGTARREGLRVGDEVRIGGSDAAATAYRLVGLTQQSKGAVEARGAVVGMVLRDTLALSGDDRPQRVLVAAGDGIAESDLAGRIRAAMGGGAEVRTHDELVSAALERAVGDARTFRTALLGFGLIVVAVAAFVIANTFTIVLAQRTRETALLRLVGATRRQVFRSLVVEAAVLGLAGSLLGLLVGAGLAYALRAGFAALGASLPSGLTLTPATVAISVAVGAGVTVLSALLPTRRGTGVAPVAALSDTAVQDARRTGRGRRGLGIAAFLGGTAALTAAATTGVVEAVVAGTLLAFVGFVLLSPAVVPAVVRLLGVPAARLGGTTVSLALRNAVRNPRRIAATTNALVIGVTLVSTFTLMNESAKAPAEGKADARFGAHFLVTDGGTLSVLPPALVDSLRRMPELGTLYPQWEAFDGGEDDFLAVHAGYPVILSRGYPEHDGSIAALTPGTAVVTRETGIPVGQKVTVRGRAFTVVAAVPDTEDSAVLERSVWLTPDDLTKLFPKPSLSQLQADPASGVPASAARAALDRAARDFPTMTVHDRAAYVAELNAPLEQMLAVVTGLLVLAVVVALIGVANTLTLSVLERTRENTLLRAVGLTRRQLRGTLAAEALVMALTGTVLGVVASLVITRTLLSAIGRRGADLPLVVPWDRLGVLLAVAVVAALAASVLPARRAARRPVAENLAGE